MSDDPTDNALAAIASILDQPREPAKAADKADPPEAPIAGPPPLPQAAEPEAREFAPSEPPSVQQEPVQPQPVRPIEANGYSKAGPGPMAALRFRWSVREEAGRYYVDETVGEGSTPLVNGPMDRDEAIKFVDDREAAARQRFDHFKQEMISGGATASPVHTDRDI
ncbi:hypothetical protein [Bradyrhizobium genosp. L]|uniref:hypothetical protein n=1 Tax=Bradyrhizobium genosp. L TaxID=83637 RepID=UPI001FED72C2|nr:hypothetical protein [Bradyrhizobium genosp. L]